MFCSCRISTDKRVARSLCHSRATCYVTCCILHILPYAQLLFYFWFVRGHWIVSAIIFIHWNYCSSNSVLLLGAGRKTAAVLSPYESNSWTRKNEVSGWYSLVGASGLSSSRCWEERILAFTKLCATFPPKLLFQKNTCRKNAGWEMGSFH